MNVRQFANTLKSPSGRMVLFVAGIIVTIALIAYFTGGSGSKQGPKAPDRALTGKVAPAVETASYTQERPFSQAKPGPSPSMSQRPSERATEPDGQAQTPKHADQKLGIQVYAETGPASPTQGPAAPPVQTINPGEPYAETRRYLWCELSFAVENSPFETPITGRVVKSLTWNGKVIVPEGTEVLGNAKSDRVRDRIGSTGTWTLVFPPFDGLPRGGSLVVRAFPCDRIFSDVNEDGSAGLHGRVFSATSTGDEIKFFAANLLVGAMNGLTPQQQTVYGSQIVPGFKSALYQAAGNSAERYADRIFEVIRKEGFYVRVPPGKEFYLVVDQPILLREAKVGGTLAFQPTAVAENELRRAGLLREPRRPAEPEPPKPEDVLPEPQSPAPPMLPPPSYLPPELESGRLETTKNPNTK